MNTCYGSQLVLTQGVHGLDGPWCLHIFTPAVLVFSSHAEQVGCSFHQVFGRNAALLRRGADRHPLGRGCILLFYHKVSDASTPIVLWVFPGQVGGVTPHVGYTQVLNGTRLIWERKAAC